MAGHDNSRLTESLAEAQRLAHVGSWNWDIASNMVTWSEEHYRIFGLEPTDVPLTFERFLALVHPDDLMMVQNLVEQAFRDRKPCECNFRAFQPEASVRIVHSRCQIVFDDH